jgi:hypothetical protein
MQKTKYPMLDISQKQTDSNNEIRNSNFAQLEMKF